MRDDVFRPRVACGVICEQDGRILMVREDQPGEGIVWNQPVGHLDPGEDVFEAAIRETYEETGLRVELTGLLGVYVWVRDDGDTLLRVCFTARPTGGTLGPRDREVVVAAEWLGPEQLAAIRPQLRNPIARQCLDDYAAGRRHPLDAIRRIAGAGGG
jgi:ADP-ribose pyrophosphatase YjhB (NUDIX family)